ncbi:MAG: helix-turn-helix transcriptional regulator [Flavobacteriaceae bacterium]|jgi:transcriptional regulator with XRE-family HTH domain
MINTLDFAERLKTVMDYYQLTASSFAERIGVQPSSISHLLSGRNKPSLEFVLKLLDEFKDVELYWLLNGKGIFPKDRILPVTPAPKEVKSLIDIDESVEGEIERIIIFFKNGTFKNYKK